MLSSQSLTDQVIQISGTGIHSLPPGWLSSQDKGETIFLTFYILVIIYENTFTITVYNKSQSRSDSQSVNVAWWSCLRVSLWRGSFLFTKARSVYEIVVSDGR